MSGLRRLGGNLLVALAGTGLVLAALEVFARAWPLWPGALTVFDARIGGVYQPNASGWWVNIADPFEFRSYVKINSLGLRDHEIDLQKPVGVTRVLLLGDSMVAGMEVPLEDTFAKQLEGLLRADGHRVEVINGGHYAWGTGQELLFYRHRARAFHADLVVLCFLAGNDLTDNLARDGMSPYFELGPDGGLELHEAQAAPPPPRVDGFLGTVKQVLYEHSTLYRFAGFQLKRVPVLGGVLRRLGLMSPLPLSVQGGGNVYRLPPSAELDKGWRLTQALLRQLRIEVEGEGAAFLVVDMPDQRQVCEANAAPGEDIALWSKRMAVFCRGEEIGYFDALEAFRTQADTSALFFPRDGHLTSKGHTVAAAMLHDFISAAFTLAEEGCAT